MCMCVFLSPIKVSGASYFSSAAGDVRTSSALFPALAPGEFITSPLACDCLEAIQFKERAANVFCCFSLCVVCQSWTCFFLLLVTQCDGSHGVACKHTILRCFLLCFKCFHIMCGASSLTFGTFIHNISTIYRQKTQDIHGYYLLK